MDFCYVTELSRYPIIHIVDTEIEFSATRLSDTRFMPENEITLTRFD